MHFNLLDLNLPVLLRLVRPDKLMKRMGCCIDQSGVMTCLIQISCVFLSTTVQYVRSF